VLYVIAMVAIIVGVDLVFFRNRAWERLVMNICIVLVFGPFYFRFWRGAPARATARRCAVVFGRSTKCCHI
jgi:hypothetical protein